MPHWTDEDSPRCEFVVDTGGEQLDVAVVAGRLRLRPDGNDYRVSLRGGGPCLKSGKQS